MQVEGSWDAPMYIHDSEKEQTADQTSKKYQQQGVARHGGHGSIWRYSEKKLPKVC